MKRLPIPLCLVLALSIVDARAGEYPVLTGVTTGRPGPDGEVTINFTVAFLEIGPGSEERPPADGTVTFGYKYWNPKNPDLPGWTVLDPFGQSERTDGTKTYRELARQAYDRGWHQTSMTAWTAMDKNVCVGYRWTAGNGNGEHGWAGTFAPEGTCIYAPPAQDWCTLDSKALVLDHGTVSLQEVGDTIATDVLRVTCSASTTARLTLAGSPDGRLYLGGGTSQLSADGAPVGGFVHLEPGNNDLTIRSALSGVSVGSWEGSGVLILQPE